MKCFSNPLGMLRGSGNDGSSYGVSGSKLSERIKTYSGPKSKCIQSLVYLSNTGCYLRNNNATVENLIIV